MPNFLLLGGRGAVAGATMFLVCCVTAGLVAAESSQSPTESGQSPGALEQIVVTAERRQQNPQSVPLTITVISAADARNEGVRDTKDLTFVVPGLQFGQQANGATPFIRGVGTVNGSVGNEPSVAMYVDDVYIAGITAALYDFNNISQIAVLKGPQGTLFGRNATGGVIQISTKDPTPTPAADIEVGYGNYATLEGSLYATAGLGDTVAVNVAVTGRNESAGWGTDLVTGQATFSHRDFGARTKLLWTPASSTRITLAADYNRTRNEDALGLHLVPPAVGADGQTRYNGFYKTYDNPNDYNDVRQEGASLKVEQDMGAARLVNIASWRRTTGFFLLDQDATPVAIVRAPISQFDRSVTEELHVLSEPAERCPWIGGLYYFNDLAQYDPLALEGAVAQPLDSLQIRAHQNSHSYAAFGQVTPKIGAATHLTLGVRYTRDERSADGNTVGILGAATLPLAAARQSQTWTKPTWRLALDRDIGPDVMAYVSYDRGFKSGVYNLVAYAATPVNPEVLDAYQAGIKSELDHHHLRLNGAVFYYDYQDIQVEQIVAGATNLLNAAGAKMKGIDVDAEFAPTERFKIRSSAELLSAHYTNFYGAPFNNPMRNPAGELIGGNTGTSGNATGLHTVHSPRFTAHLDADFRLPTTEKWNLIASYYYNSGFVWDPDNRLRQPAFHLLNASLNWTSDQGTFGVRLWGNNLTGAEVCNFASATTLGDFCSPSAPRTYGVSMNGHF